MEDRPESFISKYKWHLIAVVAVLVWMVVRDDKSTTENGGLVYVESSVAEPTEGVITRLKEVEPEIFKITKEEVVASKDDSRVITTYLDGGMDTFTLEQIAVIDTTIVSEDRGYRQRSGMSTAVHYGLMGYMLGRPMGMPMRRSSYANSAAYGSSQNGRTRMNSTATKRTVRSPRPSSTGKSGYGAGRSTKSYGG